VRDCELHGFGLHDEELRTNEGLRAGEGFRTGGTLRTNEGMELVGH
jgi:hypothetical protein